MTCDEIDKFHDLAVKLDGRPILRLRMSESEFENWLDEDVRAEWIDGQILLIPLATTENNQLLGLLSSVLRMFVEHHDLGQILGTGAQVRFPKLRQRRDPDLLFLSNRNRRLLQKTYIDGSPDLILEIVSPDSESRDWRDKFIDYQSAGVREYWIIDPNSQRVEAYFLGPRTKRYSRIPESTARVPSKILPGFYLRPEWLFSSPLPQVSAILKELKVR